MTSPLCLIARTRPSSYLLSPERHLPRMVPAASAAARCEPVPAFPLLPGPSTCSAWLSVASAAARCEPVPAFPLIPDPSTYPAWSLRHPSLPGVSLFRHFRSYLTLPPILHGPLRHPSLPGVSRFRRIGSYLHRVTRAPGPVLWQRASGACAERGLVRTRSHQAEPQKPEGRSGAHGHRGLWFGKGRLQSKLKEVADFFPAK